MDASLLIAGIVLGLTAGISPGPLLTLVFSETVKHGRKEGFKVAVAPLITDAPIILITILVLSKLSNIKFVLGAISILGSIYLTTLAIESLKIKRIELKVQNVKPQSLKKGVIANFLNPHPYLFWISIGGPLIIKGLKFNFISVFIFIIIFYTLLVGSKIIIAQLVEKSRIFLKSNYYVYTIKSLGFILLIFALIFLVNGIELLSIYIKI